ncbi:hypothetical protein [Absidia glauca]|uniref:C2H2-type domain-containing protein n=1 Tax=Absidia glauca TaxID=4829 RepID=A0A168QTV6_ABSGL|nr:hypothetical protein [Absidia glauca]
MSSQTIYQFRYVEEKPVVGNGSELTPFLFHSIHFQERHIHSPILFKWSLHRHQQHSIYNDMMKHLGRSLKGRLSLHDYDILASDSIGGTKYTLHDDDSLKSALSVLNPTTLNVTLQSKAPIHQTYYSAAPLIKPKVMWWHELRQINDYSNQQRKDSGIDLHSSVYLCSTGNKAKDDDYEPLLHRPPLYHALNNSEETDVPSASYSVHSSPSTVTSSSPPSPIVASHLTPTLADNKPPPWSPITSARKVRQPSPPSVYLCNHLVGDGNMCGQTFQRPYDLARHQSIHLKNRPFVYCQQCNKRFTRVDALRRHERVQGHHHHSSQKPGQHKKAHCYHPHRHPSSPY